MSMQEWYTSQTPREQFIVAATAIVGITALLYTFPLTPVTTRIIVRRLLLEAKQYTLN